MNMVKSKFYKLKKSTPFWICLLICAFLAALLPFALQQADRLNPMCRICL